MRSRRTRNSRTIKSPRCSCNCEAIQNDVKTVTKPGDSRRSKTRNKVDEQKDVRKSPEKPVLKEKSAVAKKTRKNVKTATTKQPRSKKGTAPSQFSEIEQNQLKPIIKGCSVVLNPLSLNLKNPLSKEIKRPDFTETKTKTGRVLRRSPRNNENIKKTENNETVANEKKATGNKPKNYLNDKMTNKPINSLTTNKTAKSVKNTQSSPTKGAVINKELISTSKKSLPASKFRKRKTMNYAESSLETSGEVQTKETNVNKIPVYKQNIDNESKPKQPGDTYEFDSDSEKHQKKKRKMNDSSCDEYNKTLQNILKNVINKHKRNRNGLLSAKKVNNNNIKVKQKPTASRKVQNKLNKRHVTSVPNLKNKCEKIVNVQNVQNSANHQKKIEDNNVDAPDHDIHHDDVEACFGFEKPEQTTNGSPKIRLISNIQLQPNNELNLSIATPTKFQESRPNANSTMLNNVLTPWRFNDINIRRNPHFIKLKESSLPYMNQEMVLDHTMVDKLEDHSKVEEAAVPENKTEKKDLSRKKSPVQKRVTDYFSLNVEDKENTQVSLFDNDQFSPIKSTSRFPNRIDSVKRKILGEKNVNDTVNYIHMSTPKPNTNNQQSPELENANENSADFNDHANEENGHQGSNKEECNKNFTDFGFNSDDDESNGQNTPQKEKDNRPFRFSVNANDKKYIGKRKLKRVKKAQFVESSDDESEASEANEANDLESHNGEIRLFEDISDEADVSQKPAVAKKRKLRWLHEDGENPYQHRKRKDIRTKEEEEEAEKWAAAFNSVCEEIEEFPLEIE